MWVLRLHRLRTTGLNDIAVGTCVQGVGRNLSINLLYLFPQSRYGFRKPSELICVQQHCAEALPTLTTLCLVALFPAN